MLVGVVGTSISEQNGTCSENGTARPRLPVASVQDRAAASQIQALSNGIDRWQALWKQWTVDVALSTTLEERARAQIEGIDAAFALADRNEPDHGKAYFAYGMQRLRLEFFRDTRNHKLAFAAAQDAMHRKLCASESKCTLEMLQAALTMAHRMGNEQLAEEVGL